MVKQVVNSEAVTKAIQAAQAATSAHIAAVVAPASDAYQSYIFLDGLLLGTLAALSVWVFGIVVEFPFLLGVQCGVLALFSLLPFLHKPLVRLVPKRVRHRRAAHRAFEEYLIVSRHAAADAPVVLLYVSLAERYVHILPSRQVREKITDKEWETIVAMFTASMQLQGLEQACVTAIERMAGLLAPAFPR